MSLSSEFKGLNIWLLKNKHLVFFYLIVCFITGMSYLKMLEMTDDSKLFSALTQQKTFRPKSAVPTTHIPLPPLNQQFSMKLSPLKFIRYRSEWLARHPWIEPIQTTNKFKIKLHMRNGSSVDLDQHGSIESIEEKQRGRPKKQIILIMAGMRSGSSLLGRVLHSAIPSFYYYEPEHNLKEEPNFDEKTMKKLLKQQLTCSLNHGTIGEKYLDYRWENRNVVGGKANLAHLVTCANLDFPRTDKECYDMNLMNAICSQFETVIAKTTHLPYQLFERNFDWFESKIRNRYIFKTIVLIRDPRSIYLSRKEANWCSTRCMSIDETCTTYLKIHQNWRQLKKKTNFQILAIRYEDYMLNNKTRSLVENKMVNLLTSKRNWLRSQVIRNLRTSFDYQLLDEQLKLKDDDFDVSRWMRKSSQNNLQLKAPEGLSFEDIFKVESKCYEAMISWGYETCLYGKMEPSQPNSFSASERVDAKRHLNSCTFLSHP